MESKIVERVINEANYIIKHSATVRETAKKFGVGKSTVHSDVHTKLNKIDSILFEKTMQVLTINLEERHIRGGESTRLKYLNKKGKVR